MLLVTIIGLMLGSLYSLVAVGLGILWTSIRLINMGHGAILTVGAYTMYYVLSLNLDYTVAFVMTMALIFLLGLALDKLIFRHFRGSRLEVALIMNTVALGILLENFVLVSFGGYLRKIPPILEGYFRWGIIEIFNNYIVIAALALFAGVVAYYFLKVTRLGMAIRAIGQDEEAASMMGIDVTRTNMLTVGVCCLLAGIAGMLLGQINFLTPQLGTAPLYVGYIAVIFGGLTSIKGTVVSCYLLGVLEALTQLFLGQFWTLPAMFALIIAVLFLRPQGLFGIKEMV